MIRHRLILYLIAPAVFLVACAPEASTALSRETVEPGVSPVLTSTVETIPPVNPTETVQPVATSRGPELHATDPATVSLASGGLQLVEFFRFT